MKSVLILALFCAALSSSAEARQRHHTVVADPGCNIIFPCEGVITSPRGERVVKAMRGFGSAQKIYVAPNSVKKVLPRVRPATGEAYQQPRQAQQMASEVIGGRPAGCPHAFCGCGASLHLFGRVIPALNLAANWLKFPSAMPAPKMAAARVGHVMVLEQHISGNIWLVHDSNSGGGLTRLHARSIAGYRIVNPNGSG